MIDLKPATVTINGSNYIAELATCTSTTLGFEDHGIFTAYIAFEWYGGGQSAGGYSLSTYNDETKTREGTAYGCDHIMRLIKTFGVSNWEQIKGRRAYILRTKHFGSIDGIMNPDTPDLNIIFSEHASTWKSR